MSKEDKSKNKHSREESGDSHQSEHDLHPDKNQVKKDKKHQPDSYEEEIKQWQAKADELNDKYLRLYSEFDNYRKRTLKERLDLSKTASEDVILSLLPVMDDLERALLSSVKSVDGQEMIPIEGVQLIYQKFKNILAQKGLEAIESIGESFNVDYHDAITNIPAPTEELKGKVIDEVEKGYKLNGKVIRYAKVVVGN